MNVVETVMKIPIVDPDPQFRIDFGRRDLDPGRHFCKHEKAKNFHVLKCQMFSFESWGLFL
jgi:hypothetical protein